MDNVIYSSTPFRTFLPMFAVVAMFLVLAAVGLGSAAFAKKQKTVARVAQAAVGVILLLAGLGTGLSALRILGTAARTVAVHLDDKFVAHDNCGDAGTCDRRVLEMQAGGKSYDVQVDQEAYDRAQVGGCYLLTYYPGGGLFGPSEYADVYEAISAVTRIEAVDALQCP